MNNEELIKVLRYCKEHEACDHDVAAECPYWHHWIDGEDCQNLLFADVADALEAAEKLIDGLQKLGIAELLPKEGEWIHEDLDNFRKYKVTCPHCGAWYIGNYDAYDEPSDFNYCPHCGNICNPANLAWEKELSERERKEQTDETD